MKNAIELPIYDGERRGGRHQHKHVSSTVSTNTHLRTALLAFSTIDDHHVTRNICARQFAENNNNNNNNDTNNDNNNIINNHLLKITILQIEDRKPTVVSATYPSCCR